LRRAQDSGKLKPLSAANLNSVEMHQRLRMLRDSLSGQTLSGSDGRRYPLGERIGEGGQGWIFRATWNGSVDVVAKVLRPDVVTPDSLARFRREANVLRTMSQQSAPNPHVVRYYDHASATMTVPGTQDTWTFPFTVLEYVEGETLADALAREGGNGLGVERTRVLLRHIVLALRDVHGQNIVHRDLKPSNVLIDTGHGREIAKVTDFGLAKVFDDKLNRTSALAGATVGYAPPEQFERGNLRVGKPTDVFSLAAIFFEMITGEPCFPSNDPLVVLHSLLQGTRPTLAARKRLPVELMARGDIVQALDLVLARALAGTPEDRYATVTLFHDAIEDALATLGVGATLRLSERGEDLHSIPVRSRARVNASGEGAPRVAADAMTLPADSVQSGLLRASGVPAAPMSAPALLSSRDPQRPSMPVSGGGATSSLDWHVIAPPAVPRPFRTMALAPDDRTVVGVGPEGLLAWGGRGWIRLELPRFVAPAMINATAWFGHHLVLAGASSVIHFRAPDGTYTPVTFSLPGLVFHGAYADAEGVLLAGEHHTHTGSVGVIATMALAPGGALTLGWALTRLAAPLRAVTRLGHAVVACGDFGTVALLHQGQVSTAQVCPPPLLAVAPTGDGNFVVAGGGGFVFHVTPSLEARLEKVQTTKSLTSVVRRVDGDLYCGGDDRRVLRRQQGVWVRVGATVEAGPAMIRALSVGMFVGGELVAYGDDGSIVVGTARSGNTWSFAEVPSVAPARGRPSA
jgi:serine/threonine-protein kinase